MAIASEPFERSRVDSSTEIVRLLTESAAVDECVTVMPEMSITTSSDGPGSASVLQLDGVSQSPPLGLIQVTVESSDRYLELAQRRPEAATMEVSGRGERDL